MTGPFLSLSQTGEYCGGKSVRWVRRHLIGSVRHIHPPGSGILFDRESIDTYLARFIVEPVNIDHIVNEVMHPERGTRGKNQ